jgi:hypothetical protein
MSLFLVCGILSAAVCSYSALNRGRGYILWALLGFQLPIIAPIVLWCLPNLHKQESQQTPLIDID